MPLDFEKIRTRLKARLSFEEAARRANEFLKSHGLPATFTRQRINDLVAGRYADPRFSSVEALAFALDWELADLLAPTPPAPSRRRRPNRS